MTQAEIIDKYLATGWSLDYTWGDGAVHLIKRNKTNNYLCPEFDYVLVYPNGHYVEGRYQP